MKQADIGMIGLAVMGSNLARNMERNGFCVAVYDVRDGVPDEFAAANKGNYIAAHSFAELVGALKRPRVIMMMIRAGSPVDEVIDALLPLLDDGDILIDGGNSHFPDTARRVERVEHEGKLFIGTGVSGGEEGALHGPSMMPGGSAAAWQTVAPILRAICAKADDGEPCCDYIGQGGAGHFVKMVHNGIEYGDMELICEAYQIMADRLGMTADEMQHVFERWNEGALSSYLIEITAKILGHKDDDGTPLVDKILDTAGQKGTGKWTGIAALDEGIPLTLIAEAVFARCLSARKEERVEAAKVFPLTAAPFAGDRDSFLRDLGDALYAAKIISYAQGYTLMQAAAKHYGWDLNYAGIASVWRGGCIIRSRFLSKIKDAYTTDSALSNLLLDPYFRDSLLRCEGALRRVCASALLGGVAIPAFTAALTYFDGYRSARLPANLLQAQRDYFGAHTYERVDAPRGTFFHTDWTGEGGAVASTQYNV